MQRETLAEIMCGTYRRINSSTGRLEQVLKLALLRGGRADITINVAGPVRDFIGKSSPITRIMGAAYYGTFGIDPVPYVEIELETDRLTDRRNDKWTKHIASMLEHPPDHIFLSWKVTK
jgi:hypothetical protein